MYLGKWDQILPSNAVLFFLYVNKWVKEVNNMKFLPCLFIWKERLFKALVKYKSENNFVKLLK